MAREPFKTSGALSGGSPTSGYTPEMGRLPINYRDSFVQADYVVYSYGTPIAWHLPNMGVWRIPDVSYSVTTSRHQSKIRAALSYADTRESS